MENFEQKKQELVSAFEQALNDWKASEMDIFLSKTADLDGSAGVNSAEEMDMKMRSLKREDYASDEEYEKARKDIIMSGMKSPSLEARNEAEEKISNLFKQMDDLVSAYRNNLEIDKLKSDNEAKGY